MKKLTALIAVAMAAVVLSATPACSAERPILVIGDSITYGVDTAHRYTRTPGDPMRAWYSFVGETTGLPVQITAEPGSGFINKGYGLYGGGRCSGKTFAQRTWWNLKTYRPKLVIIEGGRNDLYTCLSNRSLKWTSQKTFDSVVKSYMYHLRLDMGYIGLKASDVYVIAPWGQKSKSQAWRIRSSMRHYALANGFHWVSTGFLSYAQAPDGGHPNSEGVRQLVYWIGKYSNLMSRR